MWKVKIIYTDGRVQEFYSHAPSDYGANGRMVVWEKEEGVSYLSIPISQILEIQEVLTEQ